MEDEAESPAKPAEDGPSAVALPSLPNEVASGDDELRQLVDAGASSPEELRALAARIRQHRALEESLWRQEVRPALIKAKKRRFTLRDLVDRPEEPGTPIGLVLGLLGAVLVLVLVATQSSPLWVIAPVAVVLIYAYRQGSSSTAPSAVEPEVATEDPAD